MAPKKFQIKLQKVEALTENVNHFTFEILDHPDFNFKAGQFISLHLMKDGQEHRRNYSLANSPNKPGYVEFACAYIPNGLASTALWELQPGQTLNASGPYGMLILPEQPITRYILIATGTGITPYISMLPNLAKLITTDNTKVVVLQGARTANDLLYKSELLEFMHKHGNFIFKACYSRQEVDSNTPDFVTSGYVQHHLAELKINNEQDMAYVCGNPNMVDAVFTELQALGLDRKHIKREKYTSGK